MLLSLHRVILSDEAPLLRGPVDLVAHDGPAEVVAVRAVGKRVERNYTVGYLARHVPKFWKKYFLKSSFSFLEYFVNKVCETLFYGLLDSRMLN